MAVLDEGRRLRSWTPGRGRDDGDN